MLRPILIVTAALALCASIHVDAGPRSRSLFEPASEISRLYKHIGWSLENGAPSRINAITQSRDGYLWIGGVDGLFRFDGVQFDRIEGRTQDGAPLVVAKLLGHRNGDVWIGLARGAGVFIRRGGRLIDMRMPNPSREVTALAQDSVGGVWVARGGRADNQLAYYRQGRWIELGSAQGLPPERIWDVKVGRDGTVWAVFANRVMARTPGALRFYVRGQVASPRAAMTEDSAGRVWLSDSRSTRLLGGGPATEFAFDGGRPVSGNQIVFDRQGNMWGTTFTNGVFSIPIARLKKSHLVDPAGYSAQDGLTSDQAHAIFVDREDNVWVGSELGLDVLRRAALQVAPVIPPNSPFGYRLAAARDGAVYITDSDSVFLAAPHANLHRLTRLETPAEAICTARGAGVWIVLAHRVLRVDRSVTRSLPKPGNVTAYGCAEDPSGRFWMPAAENGLFVRVADQWRQLLSAGKARGDPGDVIVDDAGRIAIFFRSAHGRNNPLYTAIGPFDHAVGRVEAIASAHRGFYVFGAKGVAKTDGDGDGAAKIDRFPWLRSVNGIVRSRTGASWVIGDAGIIRISAGALDNVLANRGRDLPHRLFNFQDGENSFPQKGPGAQLAESIDGRLWSLTRRNVLVIDPARLDRNSIVPTPAIRAVVTAARRFADPSRIELLPGTTSATFEFTALSFTAPGRNAFRYRMEGRDDNWIDGGTKRSVSYDHLAPGHYRFLVSASNNDGVWATTPAIVDFNIPPTLLQSWQFRLVSALVIAPLLWLLYRWRLAELAQRLRSRYEERLRERERIARELHDTLLQGVQGLILRISALRDTIAVDEATKSSIDAAIERAERLLVEGRDRVLDLRQQSHETLDDMLRKVIEERQTDIDARIALSVRGRPRETNPLVSEAIVRIAEEALFNCAKHADARNIDVSLAFDRRCLELIIGDDGRGFDARTLKQESSTRNFGIRGMKERARSLGGHVSISSEIGSRTLLRAAFAATIAYRERRTKLLRTDGSLWGMMFNH